MAGQIEVPDDFNSMCADEIEAMFYGEAKDCPRSIKTRLIGC
jgi:hypothetical protein